MSVKKITVFKIKKELLDKQKLFLIRKSGDDNISLLMPLHKGFGIHDFLYEIKGEYCYILGVGYEWSLKKPFWDFVDEVISPIDHVSYVKSDVAYKAFVLFEKQNIIQEKYNKYL